jgi:hypothetical protein
MQNDQMLKLSGPANEGRCWTTGSGVVGSRRAKKGAASALDEATRSRLYSLADATYGML